MGWASRSLARMVFPTLARHGWSYARMLRYAKTKKWVYAPKVMASDIREMRSSALYSRKVMDLSPNVLIPKNIMVETELTMKRKYRIFGLGKYRNVETDRVAYFYKSKYRNELLSKEEYSKEYIAWQNQTRGTGDWLCEDFQIIDLHHFEGYPY